MTLPADYVREHVRLGYAATEHGYQSDTVTIGIDLASTATTQQGLYVATTRGREENWICVVTESHDVTEARDVLERILAVDRADIPAVTQRRQLAEQDHEPAPARRRDQPGRCEIPAWFDPLRDQTRQELDDAERRAAVHAAKRERLQTELDAAQYEMNRLEEPTRWDRQRLTSARDEVEHATSRHQLAAKHLDSVGIRGGRQARREFAAAENELTWARDRLKHVQASISPDVERYHEAWHQVRDLRQALRSHQTRELTERWTSIDLTPHLHERLDALNTWWRFAKGDSIGSTRLGEIVDILDDVDDDHGRYRWLIDAVEQHCLDAGIHLPTLEPEAPGIETPGLDIGL